MPTLRTQSSTPIKAPAAREPLLFLQLTLACVCMAALMYIDKRGGAFSPLRQSLTLVMRPVSGLSNIPRQVGVFFGDLGNRFEVDDQNKRLKAELLKARLELSRLHTLEIENLRLQQLKITAERLKPTTVKFATIVQYSADPYVQQRILLNRGKSDGIYVGQPIMDAKGVIGRVVEVGGVHAIGMLLTDQASAIPIQILRNGLQTVAKGNGAVRTLILPYLQHNADVQKNDILVTSGVGGNFPPGYPVAKVIEIKRTTSGHFLEVMAAPIARLMENRQVLLVWANMPQVDMPDVTSKLP